jgi:hypothetical protein
VSTGTAIALISALAILSIGLAVWVRALRRQIAAMVMAAFQAEVAYAELQRRYGRLVRDFCAMQARAVAAEARADDNAAQAARHLSDFAAYRHQQELERQLVARRAAQRHKDLDVFHEYVLDVLRDVWARDIGQRADYFDPSRNVVKTGKLHDFIHYAADALGVENSLTTVHDVARFFSRGLA